MNENTYTRIYKAPIDYLATVLTGRSITTEGPYVALTTIASHLFGRPEHSTDITIHAALSVHLAPFSAAAIKEQHPNFTEQVLMVNWGKVEQEGNLRLIVDALGVLHGRTLPLRQIPTNTAREIVEQLLQEHSYQTNAQENK